jgi:hypothetical protein
MSRVCVVAKKTERSKTYSSICVASHDGPEKGAGKHQRDAPLTIALNTSSRGQKHWWHIEDMHEENRRI